MLPLPGGAEVPRRTSAWAVPCRPLRAGTSGLRPAHWLARMCHHRGWVIAGGLQRAHGIDDVLVPTRHTRALRSRSTSSAVTSSMVFTRREAVRDERTAATQAQVHQRLLPDSARPYPLPAKLCSEQQCQRRDMRRGDGAEVVLVEGRDLARLQPFRHRDYRCIRHAQRETYVLTHQLGHTSQVSGHMSICIRSPAASASRG